MKNKILEVNHLSKNYNTLNGEVEAIKDISFDLYEQEFLTIIGTSGCGKSTLLNILADLDKETSGNINKSENLKISYMLQDDALFPWLTVFDNAILGLKITKNLTNENINYVNNLLDKYGLSTFKNKYPKELSGGMKKKVSLVRALALKPDILLLDEAFSSLDYISKLNVSNDVYNIIKNEKKSVIMITHDIGEAISLSDRVIVLSKRPATIKNIYDIKLSNSGTPIKRRNDKYFSYYYDLLWGDLDKDV